MSMVYILHQPFNPSTLRMRIVPQPMGWKPMSPLDEYGQMEGLGSFFKKVAQTVTKIARAPIKLIAPKLAKSMEKIDNKIINKIDSVHTSVNVWAKKHSTFLIIVAAIAITIYTMGAGATIAAKMLSGMQAIAAKTVAAKAAVGAWFTGGGAAAGAAGTAATGVGTTATVAGSSWLATGAKVALAGAQMLMNGKKVSDLSADQAQQMLAAQNEGYDMVDPALAPLLRQRVSLGGNGPIQFDANGQPIEPGAPGYNGGGSLGYPGDGGGGSPGYPGKPSNQSPSWLMPALVGAGVIGLVLVVS